MEQIVDKQAGHTITFLEKSKDTSGKLTRLRVQLYPNSDNLLHFHTDFTQEVIALEGTVCIKLVGGERQFVEPGNSFFVERRQPHAVINPGAGPIEYEIICRPGQPGLEKAYRLMFGLTHSGIRPSRIDRWLIRDLKDTFPVGLKYKVFNRLKGFFLFKWMLYKRLKNLEKKIPSLQ